ncbi:Ethyl tert-butyl ether degradation EthD [Frankia sp. AiPs1]|uniref:DUF4286 family protein n=1 Tax=Frankia sp. AiPa1 TaxID=573492 RepID=UPI00202B65F0|nr:DUF4286 family protein [Frankia sp. AiPa1]MCL9760062.1 hypothetical protein [Frankia sp. AiPa1]
MSGVLVVESGPASPEEAAAYHDWYDNTHIPEILTLDGFVSARRLAAGDGDTFLVIYEIDGDVEVAKATLAAANAAGTMSPPKGLQLKPPPRVRYYSQLDNAG